MGEGSWYGMSRCAGGPGLNPSSKRCATGCAAVVAGRACGRLLGTSPVNCFQLPGLSGDGPVVCVLAGWAAAATAYATYCRCPQRVHRTGSFSMTRCTRSVKRSRDRRNPLLPQNAHARSDCSSTTGVSPYGCTRCFVPALSLFVTPMRGSPALVSFMALG